MSSASAAEPTHRRFQPAPYKLIPFSPAPWFLAVAGLGIAGNLLVLLGVLINSLKPNLVEQVKNKIRPRKKEKRKSLRNPTPRCADGSYEMDVGVDNSNGIAGPSIRAETDVGLCSSIATPGSSKRKVPSRDVEEEDSGSTDAAMRDSIG